MDKYLIKTGANLPKRRNEDLPPKRREEDPAELKSIAEGLENPSSPEECLENAKRLRDLTDPNKGGYPIQKIVEYDGLVTSMISLLKQTNLRDVYDDIFKILIFIAQTKENYVKMLVESGIVDVLKEFFSGDDRMQAMSMTLLVWMLTTAPEVRDDCMELLDILIRHPDESNALIYALASFCKNNSPPIPIDYVENLVLIFVNALTFKPVARGAAIQGLISISNRPDDGVFEITKYYSDIRPILDEDSDIDKAECLVLFLNLAEYRTEMQTLLNDGIVDDVANAIQDGGADVREKAMSLFQHIAARGTSSQIQGLVDNYKKIVSTYSKVDDDTKARILDIVAMVALKVKPDQMNVLIESDLFEFIKKSIKKDSKTIQTLSVKTILEVLDNKPTQVVPYLKQLGILDVVVPLKTTVYNPKFIEAVRKIETYLL